MSIIDPRIANSDLSLTIDVLSYPSLISDEIKLLKFNLVFVTIFKKYSFKIFFGIVF